MRLAELQSQDPRRTGLRTASSLPPPSPALRVQAFPRLRVRFLLLLSQIIAGLIQIYYRTAPEARSLPCVPLG